MNHYVIAALLLVFGIGGTVGSGLFFNRGLYSLLSAALGTTNIFMGFMCYWVGYTGRDGSLPADQALLVVGPALGLLLGLVWTLHRLTIVRLRGPLGRLAASVAQISATAAEAAAIATQQSETVSRLNGTIETIRTSTQSSTGKAGRVVQASEDSAAQGRAGLAAVQDGLRVIDEIGNVGEIVDTITDMAKQSSILAVNAAIEAATVEGEGRGFASVSAEVRRLAEQSKAATTRIREAIRRTTATRAAMESVQQVVGELADVLEEAKANARQIAGAMSRQDTGMAMISDSMASLVQGSETSATAARTLERSVDALSRMSESLRQSIEGRS
jgi:methyl-accepting chemotaxis protein